MLTCPTSSLGTTESPLPALQMLLQGVCSPWFPQKLLLCRAQALGISWVGLSCLPGLVSYKPWLLYFCLFQREQPVGRAQRTERKP